MDVVEKMTFHVQCASRFLVLIFIISSREAQTQCPNDEYTFERTAGVTITSSHFLLSELHMIENVANGTWHYECYLLCKATSNCGGFYVDHVQENCRLLPMTSSAFRLAFQPHTGSYFEKICLQAPACSQQWAFDRVVGMELTGHDNKILQNVTSKTECQMKCLQETEFECKSAEYNYDREICSLSKNDRRSSPKAFQISKENIDYLENQCIKVPSKCIFSRKARTFSPYALVKITKNMDEVTCREKCKSHDAFVCRAFIYKKQIRECLLSSDDTWSVGPKALSQSEDSDYYEKTDCLDVRMKCDASSMTAILTLEYPFKGKVYAMVNPNDCSTTGKDNSNHVQITLPLKSPLCGTINEGNGTYTNSIIVQHHPNILTSSDRRIDVVCDYEEHKVRLKAGKQIEEPDVTNISSVVTGIAPTPDVQLKLVDANGEDVIGVDLGSNVFLRVELLDEGIYGIIGTHLIARSGDGSENMTLIDERGCPVETSVFPPFQLVPGSKSLEAPFQAFRFASDSTVKFQITISFCLNQCKPAYCDTNEVGNVTSYGRKRRSFEENDANHGDIISDVVKEGAIFVRARLERNDIAEISRTIPESSIGSRHSKQICSSSVIVIGVGIMAAIIQIVIAGVCVFITCGRKQVGKESITLSKNKQFYGIPSLISTSSKTGLCEVSTHNSLAGYIRH